MYAKVENFETKISIYAEDDDLCSLCVNTQDCPLLNAIQSESVVLRYENVQVEKCGMHQEIPFEEIYQMIAF